MSVVCLKNQFPNCPVNTVARLQDSLATLGFQFVAVIQTFKDRWTLIARPDLTVDVAHQIRWIIRDFAEETEFVASGFGNLALEEFFDRFDEILI